MSTAETVAWETPAVRATSRLVVARCDMDPSVAGRGYGELCLWDLIFGKELAQLPSQVAGGGGAGFGLSGVHER